MRTEISTIRRIHSELLGLISEEPRELPFTDAELSARLTEAVGTPVTGNQVWYYRRELRIENSKKRKRKYKYEENKNVKVKE